MGQLASLCSRIPGPSSWFFYDVYDLSTMGHYNSDFVTWKIFFTFHFRTRTRDKDSWSLTLDLKVINFAICMFSLSVLSGERKWEWSETRQTTGTDWAEFFFLAFETFPHLIKISTQYCGAERLFEHRIFKNSFHIEILQQPWNYQSKMISFWKIKLELGRILIRSNASHMFTVLWIISYDNRNNPIIYEVAVS